MKLNKNMGTVDRIIRLVLAALFVVLYFGGFVQGVLGIILLILAVVFILASAVSFCPLYTLFKFSTRK